MHSRSSSQTMIASLLFTLSLAPSVHALPAKSAPTVHTSPRSECRCLTVSDPGVSSLLLVEASRSRQWYCAELGPKLEYMRKSNPEEFEVTWMDLYVADMDSALPVTKTVTQEPGPLPTKVLMELASRQRGGLESPGERIICRPREEISSRQHGLDDDWTENSLVIVTFLIVLVILGCVAELLDMLLCRINFLHWRYRQPIFLSGSEKILWAPSGPTAMGGYRPDDDHQYAYERPAL